MSTSRTTQEEFLSIGVSLSQSDLNFNRSFNFIRKSKKLSLYDKAIIHHIFSYHHKENKCFETYGSIAEANGVSLSQVNKTIAKLKKLGILELTEYGFNGGLRQITVNMGTVAEYVTKEFSTPEVPVTETAPSQADEHEELVTFAGSFRNFDFYTPEKHQTVLRMIDAGEILTRHQIADFFEAAA